MKQKLEQDLLQLSNHVREISSSYIDYRPSVTKRRGYATKSKNSASSVDYFDNVTTHATNKPIKDILNRGKLPMRPKSKSIYTNA